MNNNDHHNNDHHNKPPFCWCHDEEQPRIVWANGSEMAVGPVDAANRLHAIDESDVVPHEPQDGGEDEPGEEHETYVTTWGELLYLMTQGEMGTKPSETPRRYEPPRQPPPQR